jgi:hypothetical protein
LCGGLDDCAGGFLPLAGERIGELRENPQYPEMGIFQEWQWGCRAVVRQHLS